MSGLYNLLFGHDNMCPVVLIALHIDPGTAPRFRDAWVDICEDEPRMVVLTRAGGPNRADHEEGIAYLRGIEGYINDEDTPFDVTYAAFYYRVPEKIRKRFATVAAVYGRTDDVSDRFKKLVKAMRDGTPEGIEAIERGRKLLGPILEELLKP